METSRRPYQDRPTLRRAVEEIDARATIIGRENGTGADHLERQAIAIHLNHDEVVRVVGGGGTGLGHVFERDALRRVGPKIPAGIGLAPVDVHRRAATPADDLVDAKPLSVSVRVA